ncbi:MAG: 5'-nucleosidase [Steroidobacteraceae bacterium]|nr:5'-nucleosidase [Steroidobacteraceae bacterium]
MDRLPDTLVVMALPNESNGVFEAAGVPVLYCGVGKVNATRTLTRELARYAHAGAAPPMVVNFGSAGSRQHEAHRFFGCHRFVQRDMDATGLGFELGVTPFDQAPACLEFPPFFPGLPAATCGSGDSFATGDTGLACEVLDMEAYALAKVCWLENTTFACAKYVTDGADSTAARDWHDNVHKAAEGFLRLYRDLEPRRT